MKSFKKSVLSFNEDKLNLVRDEEFKNINYYNY